MCNEHQRHQKKLLLGNNILLFFAAMLPAISLTHVLPILSDDLIDSLPAFYSRGMMASTHGLYVSIHSLLGPFILAAQAGLLIFLGCRLWEWDTLAAMLCAGFAISFAWFYFTLVVSASAFVIDSFRRGIFFNPSCYFMPCTSHNITDMDQMKDMVLAVFGLAFLEFRLHRRLWERASRLWNMLRGRHMDDRSDVEYEMLQSENLDWQATNV
jgi:hypothetical protein